MKKSATKCAHEESRLTCIDCNNPVCSNCMIQCPVGFRCKSCVNSVPNPLKAAVRSNNMNTFALMFAIGLGGGWLMPFITVPFVGCFIMFFIGLFVGRWAANKVDCRLGNHINRTVIWGLLTGLLFTPCALLIFLAFETLQVILSGHLEMLISTLLGFVSCLFMPVCYVMGVLKPTILGE